MTLKSDVLSSVIMIMLMHQMSFALANLRKLQFHLWLDMWEEW